MKFILSLLTAALAFGFSSRAHAAESGSSKATSSILSGLLAPRYGIGFSQSTIVDSKQPLVSKYEHPSAVWQESSVFYPVGIRLGLREVFDQNAGVQFNGNAEQRAEIYLTQIDIGVIAYVPIPVVQPWASVGLVGGTMAITNPATRGHDNWFAAFGDETSYIRGVYYAGGVDVLFGEAFGIRVSYQEDHIETNDYYNLSGTQMKFTLQRLSVGIVGRP